MRPGAIPDLRVRARAQALDYLRQIGHPLADAARAALEVGDVALAQAIVIHGLCPLPLGNMRAACVDYARRSLGVLSTPDLPSRTRARYQTWRDQGGA